MLKCDGIMIVLTICSLNASMQMLSKLVRWTQEDEAYPVLTLEKWMQIATEKVFFLEILNGSYIILCDYFNNFLLQFLLYARL